MSRVDPSGHFDHSYVHIHQLNVEYFVAESPPSSKSGEYTFIFLSRVMFFYFNKNGFRTPVTRSTAKDDTSVTPALDTLCTIDTNTP